MFSFPRFIRARLPGPSSQRIRIIRRGLWQRRRTSPTTFPVFLSRPPTKRRRSFGLWVDKPDRMLELLQHALDAALCPASLANQLRRFAVWCARSACHLNTAEPCKVALETAERFLAGKATPEQLDRCWSESHMPQLQPDRSDWHTNVRTPQPRSRAPTRLSQAQLLLPNGQPITPRRRKSGIA